MPAGGSEVVTARRHYVATFVLDPSVEHFPSGPSSRHRTRPKPFVSRRSCGHAALNHTDAAADFEIGIGADFTAESSSEALTWCRLCSREQLRRFHFSLEKSSNNNHSVRRRARYYDGLRSGHSFIFSSVWLCGRRTSGKST